MPDVTVEITEESLPTDLLLLSDPSEEVIAEYIGDCVKFRALSDGETVGALLLLKTRPKTMEIMNVSVYERYQNRGIGKRLINKAVEYAKEKKMSAVEIGTGNPGAMQLLLYQKCGFRIVGIEFDYFRKNHQEPIYENGIECRDMIRLRMEL